MTESEFWIHLEFRVSGELARLPDRDLRHRWCDGFDPHGYHLNPPDPRITGLAWIVPGHARGEHEQWPFTLFLPRAFEDRSDLDWSSLLPPENVTCWLGVDAFRKRLEIDLASAISDDQYLATIQLTLYTRPGCHLCERLESLLAPILQSRQIELTLHDITDDDAVYELYWSRIPVLMHEGVVILEGRPSESQIAAAMKKL